jgi:hypothetical protein
MAAKGGSRTRQPYRSFSRTRVEIKPAEALNMLNMFVDALDGFEVGVEVGGSGDR